MADANITVVNFDQFELLLKYCVSWKTADPDTDSKFSSNDNQRFINVDNGVLYIYEAGNATPIYASGAAPTEYVKSVGGANGKHHFTLVGGETPEYDIWDVHLLTTAPQNADFLPYVSIAGRDFLIPQVSKPATGTATTYLDYLSVNGTEYKLSTFDGLSVRWNSDEQYYDVSVVNNKGQLDLSFFARKTDIPTIPVADVQTSTDGTTYATVVDANKIAKIDLSSFLTSSDINDMATQTWVSQQGFLTSVGWTDLTGTAPNVSTFNNDAGYLTSVSWSDLTGTTPSLSDFTNDLVEGNPTVPSGTTPITLVNLKIGANYFSIPQGGGGGTPNDYIISLSANGNTLSWTSLVGGTSSSGSFTPSGGSEPAAYIKSISKSGRTLTWTNKDNTTDSLDTSYNEATQSVAGLLSAADKTKLDNIFIETLYSGSGIAGNSLTGNVSQSYIENNFDFLIIVGKHEDQSDYSNAGALIPTMSISSTVTIPFQPSGWGTVNCYVYWANGNLSMDCGGGKNFYVRKLVGIRFVANYTPN